jgi:two-component system, OmpR family, response regulator
LAKVLLVDDDELVRKVVKVVVEAEGHQVVEAPDGAEALEVMQRQPAPDVVVLDLLIPGQDGFDICRRLKAVGRKPQVLVLTSVPIDESEEAAREAGADDVMGKPFSAMELLRRLSALLGE